jgi:hypothetical protein
VHRVSDAIQWSTTDPMITTDARTSVQPTSTTPIAPFPS